MCDLLAIVQRNQGDVENIEEYLRREGGGVGGDPSAPPVAGA